MIESIDVRTVLFVDKETGRVRLTLQNQYRMTIGEIRHEGNTSWIGYATNGEQITGQYTELEPCARALLAQVIEYGARSK